MVLSHVIGAEQVLPSKGLLLAATRQWTGICQAGTQCHEHRCRHAVWRAPSGRATLLGQFTTLLSITRLCGWRLELPTASRAWRRRPADGALICRYAALKGAV